MKECVDRFNKAVQQGEFEQEEICNYDTEQVDGKYKKNIDSVKSYISSKLIRD